MMPTSMKWVLVALLGVAALWAIYYLVSALAMVLILVDTARGGSTWGRLLRGIFKGMAAEVDRGRAETDKSVLLRSDRLLARAPRLIWGALMAFVAVVVLVATVAYTLWGR